LAPGFEPFANHRRLEQPRGIRAALGSTSQRRFPLRRTGPAHTAPPGFNCCIGSPIDDRQYSLVQSFGIPWTSNSLPSTVGTSGALFVVTYVDFLQELLENDPDEGQDKLVQYGAASIKQNNGHLLSYSVLQQLDRPNRYVFLEVWDTEPDYTAWQSDSVTTKFVAETMPLLGSPFDHRLNILCGKTYVDGTGCVPPNRVLES
jgi:quinol monooxygenase YgiN